MTHDTELVSSRVFDAPRARLFAAFTDPEVLASWWGPRGFTNEFQHFDLRPGGDWRFVMRGPDGREYQMTKTFVEVAAPERIVLDHHSPMHAFRMTMTFAEAGDGRTELTWRMRFEHAAELEPIRGPLAEANEQNFDRLESRLAT